VIVDQVNSSAPLTRICYHQQQHQHKTHNARKHCYIQPPYINSHCNIYTRHAWRWSDNGRLSLTGQCDLAASVRLHIYLLHAPLPMRD